MKKKIASIYMGGRFLTIQIVLLLFRKMEKKKFDEVKGLRSVHACFRANIYSITCQLRSTESARC